jgi:hypothetical protein
MSAERITLSSGVGVCRAAVDFVDGIRARGIRIWLRDRGMRFTVSPASLLTDAEFRQCDSSLNSVTTCWLCSWTNSGRERIEPEQP